MPREAVIVDLPTLSVSNNAVNYLWDSTAPIGVAPAASYTNFGHGQVSLASSTFGPLRRHYHGLSAIQVQVRCTDQNVTIKYNTFMEGGTSWTTWNGSGSGETVTAGTPAEFTFDCWGQESQVTLTNGGTGPTILQASLKLIFGDRGGA